MNPVSALLWTEAARRVIKVTMTEVLPPIVMEGAGYGCLITARALRTLADNLEASGNQYLDMAQEGYTRNRQVFSPKG